MQAVQQPPHQLGEAAPLALGNRFQIRAVHAFERIDIRALNRIATQAGALLAVAPTMLRLDSDTCAVCLRYGVVVFIGAPGREPEAFERLMQAAGSVRRPGNTESEELSASVDQALGDRVVGDEVLILDTSVERLQIIAEALARSVILASYEVVLGEAAQRVEPLLTELGTRGSSRQSSQDLLKTIGSALQIRQALVNRAEVGDKPEQLWERPELEKLFSQLTDELEIRERNAAIEAKLSLIAEIANTALDLIRYSRTLRVEWYIALLIVVDIILTIFKSL